MRGRIGAGVLVLAAGTGAAHGDTLKARVMVLPAGGTATEAKIPADVAAAVADGARRVTPNVARSTASLTDTAVIVGCDPAAQACLEAVAAALNVDQMLLVKTSTSEGGGDVTVDVTAVSRESAPVTQQFVVHPATRKQDVAKIAAAVPGMLDAELATSGGGGGGGGGRSEGRGEGEGEGRTGTGTGTGTGGGAGNVVVDGGRSTKGPMIMTIAGGGLAVLGLAAWTMAAVKQGDIDDAPTATAADLERLADLESSARGYATLGNGLVIAGAVTMTAGAVWWWKAGRSRDTAVTPMVGSDRAGVVLEGRW